MSSADELELDAFLTAVRGFAGAAEDEDGGVEGTGDVDVVVDTVPVRSIGLVILAGTVTGANTGGVVGFATVAVVVMVAAVVALLGNGTGISLSIVGSEHYVDSRSR
jgi:hypothetical protein